MLRIIGFNPGLKSLLLLLETLDCAFVGDQVFVDATKLGVRMLVILEHSDLVSFHDELQMVRVETDRDLGLGLCWSRIASP